MTKPKKKMTIREWRNRHRRCKFCRHSHWWSRAGLGYWQFRCRAKRKEVSPDLPRPFCRLFELEDES